jgi:hypothetical protein
MGGFCFGVNEGPRTLTIPGGLKRLTLTTNAIRFLAKNEPDLIPDISEESIQDRSKADRLSKILTCLQALWFCTQFLYRLGVHYPVTLLELSTFAHCLCAFTVYILWWYKPFGTEEPVMIPTIEHVARKVCAAMYFRSHIGRRIDLSPGPSGFRPTSTRHIGFIEFEEDLKEDSNEIVDDATSSVNYVRLYVET